MGKIDILEPVVAYNQLSGNALGPWLVPGRALECGVIPGANQGGDNGDMSV